MSNFQAVYYRDADGIEPVLSYIDSLDARRRAVLLRQLSRLNELSEAAPHLSFPYSSQVAGELRELRCHVGSESHRVLYRRSERLIVLLHAFRKSTAKVPRSEIEIAQARWRDFKARMEVRPRRSPRPAGRDAP